MSRVGPMKAYLKNIWIRIGLVLVVVGWGPLLLIVLLAAIGLWPDPNPNPIGPGLLFFFTAWPAVICLTIGIRQVRRAQQSTTSVQPSRVQRTTRAADTTGGGWIDHPITRMAAGMVGVFLLIRGCNGLLDNEGRGAAAAMVLGAAAGYWAITGRLPLWFRR